jgi:TRAP-type C4-dicarboxylate transport system permease small subunit
LRIAAILLYAIFIGILLAVTMRVSSPQSESIWSVYETPGDLIRLALGLGVCLWILFHFSCFLRMLKDIGRGYILG